MKYISAFICLLALSFFSSAAESEEVKLTNKNITAFYDYMERANVDLREGTEDLPQWLAFWEKNLAVDYQDTTIVYDQCVKAPMPMEPMGKEAFIAIYKETGINNFEKFDLDIRSLEISDDGMSAEVAYNIDLFVNEAGTKLSVKADCMATHVWDSSENIGRVKSRQCEERMTWPDRVCEEE